ncbi:MAG: sulfotransferase [Hyphomicrobiaceae bacterium]|nr:sulfotransferase [Hyphomicrobiaceae bacterium]
MPDYEVMPSEEEGDKRRKRHKKKKMGLTVERYGGRLLYMWFGMRFMTLMRLFWRGRFSFTLNCLPDTLALFLFVPWNTPLTWISEALYKKKAESLPLNKPPIFVVGHWRSGTTLMHDLFSVDPNLAFPTTFECFVPHHFLLTEGTLDHLAKGLLPKRRPQDDVPVGFERPQEEEFAMLMLGQGSPLITMAWPRLGPADNDFVDFDGVPEAEVKRWADAYMWFYRRLMLKHGKTLVMKTPPNTARIKLLTKLFPDARWVHISRSPLKVFPSTVKLWRALYSAQGLHNPPRCDEWLDDYVLELMERVTTVYERDKHLIPSENLYEIRYEDLVKNPIDSMRAIYEKLRIENFDEAEGPMRAFLADRSDHKVSSYKMPKDLTKRIADRLKPFIDAHGYREAVDAALAEPDTNQATQEKVPENAVS